MIELGCNLSPQLIDLLKKDKVEVEWIKIARENDYGEDFSLARSLRPVLLHVLHRIDTPLRPGWSFEQLNKALEDCCSPHIAVHLKADDNGFGEQTTSEREVIDRVTGRLLFLKEKVCKPLLVENTPCNSLSGVYKCLSSPGIIGEICKQADVGLLLDIAHLRVAASHRGDNDFEYLEQLPLDLIREIHMSGPRLEPDSAKLVDDHGKLARADYRLLEYALEKCQPLVVTLEYGGYGPGFEEKADVATLERQLRGLRSIAEEFGSRKVPMGE